MENIYNDKRKKWFLATLSIWHVHKEEKLRNK
jgi:hypothetical protein